MELRRIIPTDITASAIAHLSLLTLLLLFSEAHPFGTVATEQIPVEIVTPQEIAEQEKPVEQAALENKPEPAPTPQPELSQPDKPAAAAPPPPAAPAAAPPQTQAALAPPPQPAAPPQPHAATPAYKPPEPDISIKYQVLLGLPPELPPTAPHSRDKGSDYFDAAATQAADIAGSVVAQFRRHLKSCLKLPDTLTRDDDVNVKLRVLMTPEGRLAANPVPIEGRASMKALSLMQNAISALQACQPYAMLPADRYGEWKVLDLSFTPRDF